MLHSQNSLPQLALVSTEGGHSPETPTFFSTMARGDRLSRCCLGNRSTTAGALHCSARRKTFKAVVAEESIRTGNHNSTERALRREDEIESRARAVKECGVQDCQIERHISLLSSVGSLGLKKGWLIFLWWETWG